MNDFIENKTHDKRIDFNNLESKPIEKPDQKIKVPDKLETTEDVLKPLISLNLNDRWGQLKKWFMSILIESGVQVGRKLIPFWAWIIFAVTLAAMFYFKIF